MMSQRNPQNLKKIRDNIEDIKSLILPGDSLLDVGCCEGHFYDWLGHKNYTGIDLFAENIALARRRHPDVDFRVGDLFELEGSWDVVLCCRVLMHIPHFEKAIETLRKCAKRLLIVVIPIGPAGIAIEGEGSNFVYFKHIPKEQVLATGGRIIKHDKYSTVIYG